MNYFEDSSSKRFSFESTASGLNEDSFAVIQFKGYEAISTPYDFEIFLVSSVIDIDLEDVLKAPAAFTIHRGDKDDVVFNGILAEFEQLNEFNGFGYYKARLVPKLWRLTLTTHNQVFLKLTVPEIVSKTLQDGGMETADFDLSGMQYDYEPIDYVCQYRESHYNFMLRWLEREGAYYSFSQESDGEKVNFSDSNFSTEPLSPDPNLYYSPPTGLESAHLAEVIRSLTCRQIRLPEKVVLKDHNYELAEPDIEGTASVDPDGFGTSYIYGEHFPTQEEGDRLAQIRAQEMLGRKQVFYGESTVPYMSPGYSFNLNQHYRDSFNEEYLITEVVHEGFQSSLLSSGIASGFGDKDVKNSYINTFKAIPADSQYRPEHKTERPRISGTIHAKVDGELDTGYAQLDQQGRYKIRVPFDVNDDHPEGMASAWVRMIQPYAGTNRGMQFPLLKGTEVLLTFIDGNPDRPMISGAVNSPSAPGPVGADNQTESVIQTGSNNRIRMEDRDGSQRMVLESPAANSWIRIGAPNDPITLNGPAVVWHDQSSGAYVDQGAVSTAPPNQAPVPITRTITDLDDPSKTGIDDNYVSNNPGKYEYTYTSGSDTATRVVYVGQGMEEMVDTHGIRLRTAGSYWVEASSREAYYMGSLPDSASLPHMSGSSATPTDPSQLGDLLAHFGTDYNPTNLYNVYSDTDVMTTADAMKNALVSISSFDVFKTREGNIYDFGGGSNYNFGNGYEEDFMAQSGIKLNDDHALDLLDKGGPNWSSIKFPDITSTGDWSKREAAGLFNKVLPSATPVGSTQSPPSGTYTNDGSKSETQLFVTKSFGNAYEYNEGQSISVNIGGSFSVQHEDGPDIEVTYREPKKNSAGEVTGYGSIASWEKSEKGESWERQWTDKGILVLDSYSKSADHFFREEERTFDRNTGGIASYSTSQGTGMAKASFDFDYSNNTSAEFNFGLVVSSETYGGLKITNENYLGGKISNDNFVGVKLENENTAGVSLSIEAAVGGIIEIKNGKLEATFPGFGVKSIECELDNATAGIKAITTLLRNKGTVVEATMTAINGVSGVEITA